MVGVSRRCVGIEPDTNVEPASPGAPAALLTILRKASRSVTRFHDGALAGVGVTSGQLSLLQVIAQRDQSSLVELARLMAMDRTTLYRAIDLLSHNGWVRTASQVGRARIVSVTDAGRGRIAAATAASELAEDRLAAGFDRIEWSNMLILLAKLAASAKPRPE
jgi:DNA-binding MarR family transcriptional regulator